MAKLSRNFLYFILGEGRFRTLSHLDISRAVNIESWNIGCCFPLLANRLFSTGSVTIKVHVSLLLYLFMCWSTLNTQQTAIHGKKMRGENGLSIFC